MDIANIATTVLSSGAVASILGYLINSQKDQINAMKANMESMKSFMDIFKLEDIEKYVAINKKTSEQEAKHVIATTLSKTLYSKEFIDMIENTFNEIFEKKVDKDLRDKGQELFDSIIDSLANFTADERAETIKEMYPLNADAIFLEFERIEKEDPDFLKISRESYLKSLPDKSNPDGK